MACEGIRTVTIEFGLRMCRVYYTSTKLGDITSEFIISKLNRVLRKFKKCLTTFLARRIFMCVYVVNAGFDEVIAFAIYLPNNFHTVTTSRLKYSRSPYQWKRWTHSTGSERPENQTRRDTTGMVSKL